MRRRLALVAVAVLAATGGSAVAQQATEPSATGWWTRRPGAQEQPPGGFEVAGSSTAGALSVAAVRFAVPGEVLSGTLTLHESGGFVPPTAALQVCPTTDGWEPANPGAFEEAPEPDCTQAVNLEREGETWTGEVGSLLGRGGDVALVIIPAASPGGGSPLDPGFQVVVERATLATTAAPPAPPPADGGLDDFGGGAPAGPPGGSGSGGGFSFPSTPPPAGGGTTFDAPVAPLVEAPAAEEVASPPTDQVAAAEPFGTPELAAGASPGGGGGADQPWGRLVLLLPLSLVVGFGIVEARRLLLERGVLGDL